MTGPLRGIRVLEVGHMLAGPYAAMLIADLGAEVIKIEPAGGDIARSVGPHAVGPHNVYFASLNRNKRSITLDLATAAGQSSLHRLARDSHALIANLRPSAIRKLGLTYDALRACNAKLVCVALTGFGLDGPYAERPAYDYIVQAMTGVMALTGDPSSPPTKTGYSAVDNSAGTMAALGLLAKIVEGRGGQVDVAMYDVMLSQLNYLAAAWLNAGEAARRFANSAHPYVVPAQTFATRDGWLVLFITHDGFWHRFCTEAGRAEWLTDPRFATMAARREHRDELVPLLDALLATDTTQSWVDRLSPLGVVAAGVADLAAALADPHTRARDMVVAVPVGSDTLQMVGSPIRLPGEPATYRAPPLLGADNAACAAAP
jgi:crotonobetainyl-CoA:carnitine CoA-transferase CaiB-like acyl-CoA transferase